jgi:hypothetical protein
MISVCLCGYSMATIVSVQCDQDAASADSARCDIWALYSLPCTVCNRHESVDGVHHMLSLLVGGTVSLVADALVLCVESNCSDNGIPHRCTSYVTRCGLVYAPCRRIAPVRQLWSFAPAHRRVVTSWNSEEGLRHHADGYLGSDFRLQRLCGWTAGICPSAVIVSCHSGRPSASAPHPREA